MKLFEHTSWLLKIRPNVDLVIWCLKLLELSLLRERWFLILFVLVRIGIARICSLINWVTFVGWLEGNFGHARFVAQECEVSASSPREYGKEGEHDGTWNVSTANSIWWVFWFTPLSADVAEPKKVHQCPEARESEVSQYVMFSWLGRRHLFEKILASNEAHRCEKTYESNPYRKATRTAVSVDDTNVLLVFIFYVAIRPDWPKYNDGEYLKLKTHDYTTSKKWHLMRNYRFFSPHKQKEKKKFFFGGDESKYKSLNYVFSPSKLHGR